MDENKNNYEAGVSEERDEIAIPTTKNIDPKLLMAVVVLVLVAVGVVFTMQSKMGDQTSTPIESEDAIPASPDVIPPATPTGPEKVSVGQALPEGFPKELILEEGVTISEGYSIDYAGVKQLTATFKSTQSASEIYRLYTEGLPKMRWVTMNKYESETLYSIYAMNKEDTLNLTINSEVEGASTVVISLLSK